MKLLQLSKPQMYLIQGCLMVLQEGGRSPPKSPDLPEFPAGVLPPN
jgi:hypothetical protein